MSFLTSLFGDSNEAVVKKLQPTVEKINKLEKDFEQLSDTQLKEKTAEFRARLNPPTGGGETLDDLLP